ncbi:hypothetical protein ACHQM5_026517 [Ranunculus cassubicifolius]
MAKSRCSLRVASCQFRGLVSHLTRTSDVLDEGYTTDQGIMVTGVTFFLQAGCIEKKGHVYEAMSTPLSLILTTLCSVVFLGEAISYGSVLGVLLVGGLYIVFCPERAWN